MKRREGSASDGRGESGPSRTLDSRFANAARDPSSGSGRRVHGAGEHHAQKDPQSRRLSKTSVSRRTSTPGRRPRPSASCFTPGSITRSARCTTALPPWTWMEAGAGAWDHDHVGGDHLFLEGGWICRCPSTGSTSSTRRGTSISRSRSNAACGCWDGACMVYCAVGGVQPQSGDRLAGRPNKYRVPRLAFVNKMDRTGANFFQGPTSRCCAPAPEGEPDSDPGADRGWKRISGAWST